MAPLSCTTPSAACRSWSGAEDEALRNAVAQAEADAEQSGSVMSWTTVSAKVGRPANQCKNRWKNDVQPKLVKGPWTKEEDELLAKLVHEKGPKHWTQIARYMKGRVGKQCNERWHNHLSPDLKKGPFTPEEDRILLQKQAELGNKWAQIAKYLPGRAQNSIKNRWNATLKRKKRGEKSEAEWTEASRKKRKDTEKKTKSVSSSRVVPKAENGCRSARKEQCLNRFVNGGASGPGQVIRPEDERVVPEVVSAHLATLMPHTQSEPAPGCKTTDLLNSMPVFTANDYEMDLLWSLYGEEIAVPCSPPPSITANVEGSPLEAAAAAAAAYTFPNPSMDWLQGQGPQLIGDVFDL